MHYAFSEGRVGWATMRRRPLEPKFVSLTQTHTKPYCSFLDRSCPLLDYNVGLIKVCTVGMVFPHKLYVHVSMHSEIQSYIWPILLWPDVGSMQRSHLDLLVKCMWSGPHWLTEYKLVINIWTFARTLTCSLTAERVSCAKCCKAELWIKVVLGGSCTCSGGAVGVWQRTASERLCKGALGSIGVWLRLGPAKCKRPRADSE